ncbi:hypothetical protein LC605_25100 [Nostoc sp. CHAB 5836]|uniref:hypothetical protein n=1 Tax=Nostoc sp. CHAB 5836 TaxID=2780404 RepID=UPI001E520007|nr:hypothetical protein [Nostoc sp. CHAB 5836]MCC5618301.1 hypothetical protein [Nostoc sp. CHAB 5836]
MTHSTYTEQAPSSFKLNQTLVANAPSKDEQVIAQAELNHHLATQGEAVAPTLDPLTARDRRIIGEIIQAKPESVRTIWIEGGITVWVQFLNGGRLAFDRNWFALRVQEVKATLPEEALGQGAGCKGENLSPLHPAPCSLSSSPAENAIMCQIFNECEKYGFGVIR